MKILFTTILLYFTFIYPQSNHYLWKNNSSFQRTVANIPLPAGFSRIKYPDGSFSCWLQNLPLKPDTAKVHLYNGKLKRSQNVHFAVIDIDVGKSDLQQCADAVMRLRAEYLFANNKTDSISFNFSNGDPAKFEKWTAGYRPVVNSNKVSWIKKGVISGSYSNFRKYLNTVFMYAGSYSLSRQIKKVKTLNEIKPGDVFIQGGFPGHAIIVVDAAKNTETGETAILLAQSFMPAQEIHILKNFKDSKSSPWFIVGKGKKLFTPEWTFKWDDLKAF